MNKHYDVIIAGTGAAGLYAALNLDPALRVLMLCKKELLLSNSNLAQGGIAAVLREDDDFAHHIEDSLIAGGYQNNVESLTLLIKQGPSDVKRLISLGVPFDRDEQGHIHMTLEGGHSKARILHHKDSTGNAIVSTLAGVVSKLPNVTILQNTQMIDLKKKDDVFFVNILTDSEQRVISSDYVILATGGIGRVYEYTTNSKIATGDGIYIASKAGAVVKNMHLIQFHPTAFAHADRERFLISEAVRGEGAYFLNSEGERFMFRYDERGELAPRDVVSRSIIAEANRLGNRSFYLDITHKDSEFLKNRFPMIYKNLLDEGFDLTKDKIPVFPCQHYLMGGISVGLNGQTSIEDLYGAGECTHTGVHGNNRLASNSLLEAIVFARIGAQDINRKYHQNGAKKAVAEPADAKLVHGDKPLPHGFRTQIRHIMQNSFFVVPNLEEAKRGLVTIEEIIKTLECSDYILDTDLIEARSLACVAKLILKDVLANA